MASRAKYPVITAKDAARKKTMPTEAKMLVRDFIDDSLYHPHYGYFSKQAVIFSPETDFEFEKIKDNMEFLDIIAEKYKEIEDDMDIRDEVARQVWHTPTELFKVREVEFSALCLFEVASISLISSSQLHPR